MKKEDWIRVTDRLPEDKQQTLIHNAIGICMAIYDQERGVWIMKGRSGAIFPPCIVTHWMPIVFPED